MNPFISPDEYGEKDICKYKTAYKLSNKSWKAFRANAKKWSAIDVHLDDERHTYTNVYSKVVNSENSFGVIHDVCRIHFWTLIVRYEKKYGFETASEEEGK